VRDRMVVPPIPACDPRPLGQLWDPVFESYGKPNSALLAEFDRRADALLYADGALACWRQWVKDVQFLATEANGR
jgi:hypothetical protein